MTYRDIAREIDRRKFWQSIHERDAEALYELRERQRMDALDARAEVILDDDME